MRKPIAAVLVWALLTILPLQARAGIPVIDVAAIAQLVQEIAYWKQQIQGMTDQLNQLQQTYNSMTGNRGMENLLPTSNAQRNYLPQNYSDLTAVGNGSSLTYAGLASQVQSVMAANAVLSNAQLNAMTPTMQQTITDGRRSAAMMGSLHQAAFQNTSQRFSALQSLINAIGGASDPKAIADLQGRVAAEQAMLSNEQTKLQSLQQVMQADQVAQQQRRREQAIQQIGDVDSLSSVSY